MNKNFVVFCSPGTFFDETSEYPIEDWDIKEAIKISKKVTERYNAKPYGFYFITKSRNNDDLDSHVSNKSNMYYLGGKIETLSEVKARATKNDKILIDNMICNHWDKIITNTNSWKITKPFLEGDILLTEY